MSEHGGDGQKAGKDNGLGRRSLDFPKARKSLRGAGEAGRGGVTAG